MNALPRGTSRLLEIKDRNAAMPFPLARESTLIDKAINNLQIEGNLECESRSEALARCVSLRQSLRVSFTELCESLACRVRI